MTEWAKVEDGEVTAIGPIPHHWRLDDGRWVSGYDWLGPERWRDDGWLPVIDIGDGQVTAVEVAGDTVVRVRKPVEPHSDAEQAGELEDLRHRVETLERALAEADVVPQPRP